MELFLKGKYKLKQKEFETGNGHKKLRIDVRGMARANLYELFSHLNFKVGAEIGVWLGRNAAVIVEKMPGVKLYLVDPYENHGYVRKQRGDGSIVKARKVAHRRLKEYDNKEFVEKMSEEAYKDFDDFSLDFVYIDGEHTYDQAMLDIILWSRKVRSGGIVSGHDFVLNPKRGMEVRAAVEDYTRIHGLDYYVTDPRKEKEGKWRMPSFFWVKP